ncbi:coagulation factor VIII-like [Stylophora pistillata]|uniref:coagulation factor VIII-like n=1 Tax=Stylophora pistillata TaxID=50429 RepID=UPI000C052FAD|nr:coagulation factor VIII-like [Stylophora pistillata]
MFRLSNFFLVLILFGVSPGAKFVRVSKAEQNKALKASLLKRSTRHSNMARSIWDRSCTLPLGMESGYLPDSALSASSSYSANEIPQFSRLNKIPAKGKAGAWCAKSNNHHQWLQVFFGRETTVTKVAIQGRYDCCSQRVTSFKLSYSSDGIHWAWYRLSDGQIQVFGGNADGNTPVYNFLHPHIEAIYVRFHPWTWHNHISMRAEVYGCNAYHCQMSLGMEDGRIKDSAMSASSSYSAYHVAKLGRLNLVPPSGYAGAWCVKTRDTHQWIQVDLGRPSTVTKVATQGRQDCCDQWVTSYAVSYSLVSPYWVYYMSHGKKMVFPGNFDRHSIVTHEFVPAFHARRVKIHPLSYHKWISMRIELYGCPIKGI